MKIEYIGSAKRGVYNIFGEFPKGLAVSVSATTAEALLKNKEEFREVKPEVKKPEPKK